MPLCSWSSAKGKKWSQTRQQWGAVRKDDVCVCVRMPHPTFGVTLSKYLIEIFKATCTASPLKPLTLHRDFINVTKHKACLSGPRQQSWGCWGRSSLLSRSWNVRVRWHLHTENRLLSSFGYLWPNEAAYIVYFWLTALYFLHFHHHAPSYFCNPPTQKQHPSTPPPSFNFILCGFSQLRFSDGWFWFVCICIMNVICMLRGRPYHENGCVVCVCVCVHAWAHVCCVY